MIIRQRYRMRRVLPLPILAFQLHDAKVLLKEENRPTFLLSKYGQLLSRIVMAGRVASVSDTEKVFRLELEDPTGIVECLFFKAGLFSHPEAVRDEMSVLNSLSTGDEILLIGKVRYEQYKEQESTRIFIEQISRASTELVSELYERAITELRQTIVRPPAMPDVYLREAQAYYGKIQNFIGELQDIRSTLRSFYEGLQKSLKRRSNPEKTSKTVISQPEATEQLEMPEVKSRRPRNPVVSRASPAQSGSQRRMMNEGAGIMNQELEEFIPKLLKILQQSDGRSEHAILKAWPDADRCLGPALDRLIQDGKLFINQQGLVILL